MNRSNDTTLTKSGGRRKGNRIIIMERRAFGNDLSVRLKVLGTRFPDNDNSLDELIRNPHNVPLSLITLNDNKELVSIELINSIAADNAIKYFENNEDGITGETFEFPQMDLYSVEIGEIIRKVSRDIWDDYEI